MKAETIWNQNWNFNMGISGKCPCYKLQGGWLFHVAKVFEKYVLIGSNPATLKCFMPIDLLVSQPEWLKITRIYTWMPRVYTWISKILRLCSFGKYLKYTYLSQHLAIGVGSKIQDVAFRGCILTNCVQLRIVQVYNSCVHYICFAWTSILCTRSLSIHGVFHHIYAWGMTTYIK